MRWLLLVIALAGCGQDDDRAGSLCSQHGGVQLIEGGYIYCDDGTYFEE